MKRVAAAIAAAAALQAAAAPLAESRCAPAPLVDAAFREAALRTLETLSVRAPGQPADGALRTDLGAAHVDAEGRVWHRVSAYPANLAVIGAVHASARMLPLTERWLRWQARLVPLRGQARGVVVDQWLRPDTLEQTPCPPGRTDCHAVDAHDSTAASLLLAAEAWQRAGGAAAVLREPAMRLALDNAASVLQQLARADGLTLAKPDHAVVYTMDQVEVAAGWRAWSRLLRDVYAQPASADVALAEATRLEAAFRQQLATPRGWKVSLDSSAPDYRRWYADTVAQAWPLLWLAPVAGAPDAAHFRRAIEGWQRPGRDWTAASVDRDGFWWPSIAVAAACTGDDAAARRWVARARRDWMDPRRPFGWPFQVADLLWLLWLAPPESPVSPREESPR